LVDMALGLGYDRVIVLSSPGDIGDMDIGGVDGVVSGCLLRPDGSGELKSLLGRVWSDVGFVVVWGDEGVCRAAVGDERVDLLVRSECRDVIDHVLAKECGENGRAVGFDCSRLLKCSGYQRALQVKRIQKDIEVLRKYEAPVVYSMFPENRYDLKAPRDFKALLGVFGFDSDGGFSRSMQYLESRVTYKRRYNDDGFVEPGVEIVEGDD